MRTKKSLLIFGLTAIISISFFQCNPNEEPKKNGNLVFKFDHRIDNDSIIYDSTMYVNAAGNPYQVNLIQYFITDVTLHNSDGSVKVINEWTDYKYVDTDIPSTFEWKVADLIPEGSYSKITFTFGWIDAKNETMMFVNPPENPMMWPEVLGGGYHYIKLDGKWKNPADSLIGFGLHLGRGQIYDNLGNITGFIDNSFNITLPASSFSIIENQNKEIQIIMNVENWFKNPNEYDFDVSGGAIMQIQSAMNQFCENGNDVFSIGYIK